jgi:hypothetical protein
VLFRVEVAIFVQLDLAPLGKIAAGLARFFSPAQWAATRVELEDVEELAALFLVQVEIFVQFVLEPPLRTGFGLVRFVAEAAQKPVPELLQVRSVLLLHDRAMVHA